MLKMFLRLSAACLGFAGLTTAIAAYADPTPPARPPIWEQVAALPSGSIVVIAPATDRAGAQTATALATASAAATSARPMEADLMLRLKTEMRQAMLDALRAEMRR